MAFQVGQRVSVLLQGLHPIAGVGSWTPGTITSAPAAGDVAAAGILALGGGGYGVRIDSPVNGTVDFTGVPDDHLLVLN